MSDNGDMKDDVKCPDGEVGDKIKKLFEEESKDTSKFEQNGTEIRSLLTDTSDVIILTAMGEEAAIEAKEAPQGKA